MGLEQTAGAPVPTTPEAIQHHRDSHARREQTVLASICSPSNMLRMHACGHVIA